MKRRAGFTLIELVIVVMILGILAGVAAPKLFNTSNTATDNGLKQTLSVVRDAIELYNARYGALPSSHTTLKADLAPEFLRKFPLSPITNLDTIKALAAADDATAWMYSASTGEFICNSTVVSPVTSAAYSTY
jgi:general secretion pathway protein G